jgi:hypothetical protein
MEIKHGKLTNASTWVSIRPSGNALSPPAVTDGMFTRDTLAKKVIDDSIQQGYDKTRYCRLSRQSS